MGEITEGMQREMMLQNCQREEGELLQSEHTLRRNLIIYLSRAGQARAVSNYSG